MSGGIVVGVIHLAKSDDEKPTFEIIRRDSWKQPDEDVRPCQHRRFVLDERWATVTCGECKEKVDAFAALLYYAAMHQERERQFQNLRSAEVSLHEQELKRLKGLRDASPEDVAEITELLRYDHEQTVEKLREAVRRIERGISERKYEKRQQRRAVR